MLLFSQPYSIVFGVFFFFVCILNILLIKSYNEKLDRIYYAIGSIFLIFFLFLNSGSLSRDGDAYYKIAKNICSFSECYNVFVYDRDYVWYFLISLFKSIFNSNFSIALLAITGLIIKLFIIYNNCSFRLLALGLYIPLTYIQYDFTQLRSGLAMSWFFIALHYSINSKKNSWFFYLTNFLFHKQALCSIVFIPKIKINKKAYIYISVTVLILILLKIYPSKYLLSEFFNDSDLNAYLINDEFYSFNFPTMYLVLLIFSFFTCCIKVLESPKYSIYLYSFTVSMIISWFFTSIQLVQGRLFEYYFTPLSLSVGEKKHKKIIQYLSILISILLYIRLELVHDWILG